MKRLTKRVGGGFGLWKIVLTTIVTILFLAAFTAIGSAATIYVPDDYGTIQGAVDAAGPGDTIIVRDGAYNENVNVNKRLTIRSQNGSASTTVQASNSDDHVFNVTADYVNISGFTVAGATAIYKAGICLNGREHCNISDNSASNNHCGIYLLSSSNNNLTNNTASSNNNRGIWLYASSNNVLASNTANSNAGYGYGIFLEYSSNNVLASNTANSNAYYGIYLFYSSNNTLTNNTASSNNKRGIWLYASRNNIITSNTANSNGQYGIILYGITSNNNLLTSNTANSNGQYGIYLYYSSNNIITSNTANSNGQYGIVLMSSGSNTIYNNYFNNTNNAYDDRNNVWNTTKTAETNIIGGPYLGGNYWSDYTGEDTNGDGLGDTSLPYTSSGGIQNGGDLHPLIILPLAVHNLNTSEDFTSIRQAIDAVNTTGGDIIEVDPGTYNGNVDVTKSLTIRSTSGDPADTIVTAWHSNDHVFDVTANYVDISGFTVTGATGGNGKAGVHLNGMQHCNISDNNVTNNYCGIYLYYSSNNIITSNTANWNNNYGILLDDSSNNTLTNNTANSNYCGIYLDSSNYNTLTGNTANSNYCGISLYYSNFYNTLTNNTANSNTGMGIYLGGWSNYNTLTNNTANSNTEYGIFQSSSHNNNLTSNTANWNNNYGIYLSTSSSNTLTSNTANGNNNYGIWVFGNNNIIYNNYFNNTNNAWDGGNNVWNTTKTAGTNIIGGPYLGGNYWSDYGGKDLDGDGLGDTLLPYNSSGNITTGGDWHPLTTVGYAPPEIISFAPPSPVNDTVCNWRTFNVTVNQTVNVSWYLNNTLQHTNESVREARCRLHADAAGVHNVTAIASNANGSDMQTWIWNVTKASDLVITGKWLCWPDNCTICYNVMNIGNEVAPACHNTTLYVDGVEVAHDHVPVDLEPGKSYIGCFAGYTWTYTPPWDNITVCADNNETIDELDESNNCLTNIWSCGDVNGDGKVTMSDVRKVFNRYLDPNYPLDLPWAADVNGDGKVTMSDVRKVFNRYLDPGYELNCCCGSGEVR